MSIKDTDKGYRDLTRRVFGMQSEQVIRVGIFADDGSKQYEDGQTVADIANVHEFGLGHVPQRSFIRAYFDGNEVKLKENVVKLLESVVAGKRTKEQVLEILGARIVGEIQQRISKGISPPLKKQTIDRKGSSKPLIDTGQLRASITYDVNGKRAAKSE